MIARRSPTNPSYDTTAVGARECLCLTSSLIIAGSQIGFVFNSIKPSST